MIPTQLGLMTSMAASYALKSNKLCSDVPDQVTAMSSSVTSYWQVATGNSIGTVCGWKVLESLLTHKSRKITMKICHAQISKCRPSTITHRISMQF